MEIEWWARHRARSRPAALPTLRICVIASEAKQSRGRKQNWIASSQVLLAMTRNPYLFPGSEITPWCTSLFQMNNTTSAPIVAMMNPAP